MRLSGGEAALARWLRAAATGDPVDVRVGPLPDPDGIERRGGETWVSGGEWVVSGLGFGGEWGLRGHGVGRPVGPWGGLVASWATRPSGGGGGSVVSSFFSFVCFFSF